jgi:hypothetical protein
MPAWVAVWVGGYFVLLGGLTLGVLRIRRTRPLRDDECPTVTVLVTARNEERDLPACLAALAALDYPRERLRLVLVDDRSTDGTLGLLREFGARHSHAVIVQTADRPANGLEAKARGVAAGFAVATGEWVCITDADCVVPSRWVRQLLADLPAGAGIASGAVQVRGRGAVAVLERVSWAFTQLFSAGAAGWGVGFLGMGPNMAIRRDLYVRAGGLEAAAPLVAEDLALTQMAIGAGERVAYRFDPETTVTMAPVPSLAHLVSQQRRWLRGGFAGTPAFNAALAVAFAWGLGMSAFGLLGWVAWPPAWGAYVAARLVFDAGVMTVQSRRLGATPLVRYVPVLFAYTVFIFAVLPVSLLVRPRIAWRGTGYVVRYAALLAAGGVAA